MESPGGMDALSLGSRQAVPWVLHGGRRSAPRVHAVCGRQAGAVLKFQTLLGQQLLEPPKSSRTLLAREACPIRPMRQTLPLKSPSPPPISMPKRASRPPRTWASSIPCGDPHRVEHRQLMPFGAGVADSDRGQPRLEGPVVQQVPGVAGVEPFFQHHSQRLVQARRSC